MPKQRITKEMVVEAAFALAREDGAEQINARNIAERVGCSVQPIYSYCNNMDELRYEVGERAREFIGEYIGARIDKNDPFSSTGHAYIELAKEEANVFKLFILHRRKNISSFCDLYRSEADAKIAEHISRELNISINAARELHLNMLIYTIGLGTIFAVTEPGISPEEIFDKQESAYKAFMKYASDSKENRRERQNYCNL